MDDNQHKFYFQFRVRYAETDAQGIVFNGNYLTYFDTAIYEYFRNLAFDFIANCQLTGADFHTAHASLDFFAPAKFDEIIHAGVRVNKIGNSSLTFDIGILSEKKDKVLVGGKVVWVYVDQKRKTSSPLPENLVNMISSFEEGGG